ncbi:30S ribosomal protein S11 [Flavobacteriaceae bacterium]|nr:30S ribosomal protein S11 [Flavobacteriaceae bacterium]
MAKYSVKKNSSKKKKNIVSGVLNVWATFNNTIVSLSDNRGGVLSWSSTGVHGFKGSRKATPYAAQVTTKQVLSSAKNFGIQSLSIVIRGPGIGRESSLREIHADSTMNITSITDKTYNAHNGCRPPKKRRV